METPGNQKFKGTITENNNKKVNCPTQQQSSEPSSPLLLLQGPGNTVGTGQALISASHYK